MSYLDKLQKAKVGDTVYIKSGFFDYLLQKFKKRYNFESWIQEIFKFFGIKMSGFSGT